MLVATLADVVVLITTANVVDFAVVVALAEAVDVVTCLTGVLVLVEVTLLDAVAFGVEAAVGVTTATFVLSVSMETEYAETEKMASVPVNGSVPASRVVMNCDFENPSLSIRYVKKSNKSPEKLVVSSTATKL